MRFYIGLKYDGTSYKPLIINMPNTFIEPLSILSLGYDELGDLSVDALVTKRCEVKGFNCCIKDYIYNSDGSINNYRKTKKSLILLSNPTVFYGKGFGDNGILSLVSVFSVNGSTFAGSLNFYTDEEGYISCNLLKFRDIDGIRSIGVRCVGSDGSASLETSNDSISTWRIYEDAYNKPVVRLLLTVEGGTKIEEDYILYQEEDLSIGLKKG